MGIRKQPPFLGPPPEATGANQYEQMLEQSPDALYAQLLAQQDEAKKQEQEALAQLLQDRRSSQGAALDLSPTAAWIDSTYGTNIAPSFQADASRAAKAQDDTAKLEQELAKAGSAGSLRTLENVAQYASQKQRTEESKEQRAFDKNEKREEKIQTLKTPYGLANSAQDAKDLKAAHEQKQSFDAKIQDMIDLRKKHKGGAFFNREDVTRGKQLSKDLLLAYKDMAKLGVLSKADEAILNAIIPADPLAYDFVPGQDPILHQLEKFKEDSKRDFATRVATRTQQGLANYESGIQPSVADSQGFPRSIYKDGKVGTVTNEQELKEAQAEGWR